MNGANDLTRRQLEGTTAAFMGLDPGFQLDIAPQLSLGIANSGHVIGRDIHGDLAVTVEHLPDQSVIRQFQRWSFTIKEAQADNPAETEIFALSVSDEEVGGAEKCRRDDPGQRPIFVSQWILSSDPRYLLHPALFGVQDQLGTCHGKFSRSDVQV